MPNDTSKGSAAKRQKTAAPAPAAASDKAKAAGTDTAPDDNPAHDAADQDVDMLGATCGVGAVDETDPKGAHHAHVNVGGGRVQLGVHGGHDEACQVVSMALSQLSRWFREKAAAKVSGPGVAVQVVECTSDCFEAPFGRLFRDGDAATKAMFVPGVALAAWAPCHNQVRRTHPALDLPFIPDVQLNQHHAAREARPQGAPETAGPQCHEPLDVSLQRKIVEATEHHEECWRKRLKRFFCCSISTGAKGNGRHTGVGPAQNAIDFAASTSAATAFICFGSVDDNSKRLTRMLLSIDGHSTNGLQSIAIVFKLREAFATNGQATLVFANIEALSIDLSHGPNPQRTRRRGAHRGWSDKAVNPTLAPVVGKASTSRARGATRVLTSVLTPEERSQAEDEGKAGVFSVCQVTKGVAEEDFKDVVVLQGKHRPNSCVGHGPAPHADPGAGNSCLTAAGDVIETVKLTCQGGDMVTHTRSHQPLLHNGQHSKIGDMTINFEVADHLADGNLTVISLPLAMQLPLTLVPGVVPAHHICAIDALCPQITGWQMRCHIVTGTAWPVHQCVQGRKIMLTEWGQCS